MKSDRLREIIVDHLEMLIDKIGEGKPSDDWEDIFDELTRYVQRLVDAGEQEEA